MKHDPEEEVLPRTTILSSTRWGLRIGRTPGERRKLGVHKQGGSSRLAADYAAELEIPRVQIGAHWLAPEPGFLDVAYHPVWDPTSELDDRAYERERREQATRIVTRFERLVPNDDEVEEIARRDKSGRIREILRALDSSNVALPLILPILAERAETTTAPDGQPVGLGMSENDGRKLFLVVLYALRESSAASMDALSPHEHKDKELISACWSEFNAFVRNVHRELRHARIILPKPPDRRAQFAALESWRTSGDPNLRVQLLREWFVRIVRLAARLMDEYRLDSHVKPKLVTWLSHQEAGPRESSELLAKIREFLGGHPDESVRALEDDFSKAWREVNETRVRQDPTIGKSLLDLVQAVAYPRRR
ncbi:TPA: hypothetical protein DDZ10_03095 [Candidatus Uhrbacteria bacterium]|nr:MAG: hypothetical protein UY79_C0001G0050 [Parcubacteria group bacterium GW2011_GWA2_53_21]HBL39635.1 hypothetical protein [Candidatus Uhrbacteria bacterium]